MGPSLGAGGCCGAGGQAEAARGLGVLRFVTATFKMGGVCPVHNRCGNGFNVVIHHSIAYQLVHVLCCVCNSGMWRALWNKSFGYSSFVMRVFGYVGFSCCLFYSGYVWYLEFIYYPDKTLILEYILWFFIYIKISVFLATNTAVYLLMF